MPTKQNLTNVEQLFPLFPKHSKIINIIPNFAFLLKQSTTPSDAHKIVRSVLEVHRSRANNFTNGFQTNNRSRMALPLSDFPERELLLQLLKKNLLIS